jgi:DNA-binding transcriptional LysR family regulator
VDIKCLETFIKLSQLGSFSQVADLLQMSQPGVSKQIQRLESHLGVSLFYREGAGARLTPTGRKVYQYGAEILNQWESLKHFCNEVSGKAKDKLRIGASTVPAVHFLPQKIASFHQEIHAPELSVVVGDSDTIIEKLKNDEIDIAFVGKPLENMPEFWSEKIGSDDLVVIGPPNDSKAVHCSEEIDWLTTPFILRGSGSGTRFATEQMLAARGISIEKINCITTANDTHAIVNLVKLGVGFAIVSSLTVAQAARDGELSIVTRLPEKRYFYVACARRKLSNETIHAFLMAVSEAV